MHRHPATLHHPHSTLPSSYYVNETDAAFASIGKGKPNAMKENFDNILSQLKDLVTLTRTKLDTGNRSVSYA